MKNVPFVVFESAKGEYRRLLHSSSALADDLRVYTPGNERLSPLRFNPFEVPPNTTVGGHKARIVSGICACMHTDGPLEILIQETIDRVYRDLGLDDDMLGSECPGFPNVTQLETKAEETIEELGYSDETRRNLGAAAKLRLGSLARGSLGAVFNCEESRPSLGDLLTIPSVMELQALSLNDRNFLIIFFLISVWEHIVGLGPSDDLRLIIVIEEAHNLLGGSQRVSGSEGADPHQRATRMITQMLSELRAYGVGFVILDQTPAAISDLVRKNTGIKLVHRTNDGQDAELMAADLNLIRWRKEEIQRLGCGSAFLYNEDFHRAAKVAVQAERQTMVNISDAELLERLRGREWFQNSILERVASDFESIITRVQSLAEDTPETSLCNIAVRKALLQLYSKAALKAIRLKERAVEISGRSDDVQVVSKPYSEWLAKAARGVESSVRSSSETRSPTLKEVSHGAL